MSQAGLYRGNVSAKACPPHLPDPPPTAAGPTATPLATSTPRAADHARWARHHSIVGPMCLAESPRIANLLEDVAARLQRPDGLV